MSLIYWLKLSRNSGKSLETAVNALLNTGILTENKYQSSSEPHELKLPPDKDTSPDSGTEEISYRLSEYLRQIEYLENNYSLTPDSLTIERCSELIDFFSYINWERISPSSTSPNERMLAGVDEAVQKSDNNLLQGLVRDSKKQLARLSGPDSLRPGRYQYLPDGEL